MKQATTALVLVAVLAAAAVAAAAARNPDPTSEPHSLCLRVPPEGSNPGRVESLGRHARSPGVQLLDDVPPYSWWNGCGPTAVGMALGYWQKQRGVPLVDGGNAEDMNQGVKDMISSQGNWDDYCLPLDYAWPPIPDKSELPQSMRHQDNCVADFMYTSQSAWGSLYGWSYFSHVARSVTGYVASHTNGAYVATASEGIFDSNGNALWAEFKAEIDRGHPSVFLVDSNADSATDHFVTAIGYDEPRHEYACLNTWDNFVHWFPFVEMESGTSFGVYGATFFNITQATTTTTQAYCRTKTFKNECKATTGCHWCSMGGGEYGQCYAVGVCERVRAACAEPGFACIEEGAGEYLWCSGSWFRGLMQCPPGTTCSAGTAALSHAFPCSRVQ
eukprot:TRINITY_DN4778_c0_g1_i2.p2 TRINITY_DN4778_c0_g1~~TRINITY_DN4778_c0_g1_i2.p2  ORF type:complete len:388 (-),score=98.40 TRINITY_DN4778_c0_g1_i2:25-1188(-)